MIHCTVFWNKATKASHWLSDRKSLPMLWQTNSETSLFWLLWSHFQYTGGLRVEERNKSKGVVETVCSTFPQLRGQSEGSVAMPTVGTQLERNVDAETPTIGALPRTSHPAAPSLSFYPYLNNEWELTASRPDQPHSTSPKLPHTSAPYPILYSFCHSA